MASKVSWQNEGGLYFTSLGDCYVGIFEPDMPPFVYRVTIRIYGEGDQHQDHKFEIPSVDVGHSLAVVKQVALDKARELGCRRRRTTRTHDEAWLAELAEATMEAINTAYAGYQREVAVAHKYGYEKPPITKNWSTASLTDYFAQHYLGMDKTRKELAQAVALMLGRLKTQGLVESMTLGGERYWLPK